MEAMERIKELKEQLDTANRKAQMFEGLAKAQTNELRELKSNPGQLIVDNAIAALTQKVAVKPPLKQSNKGNKMMNDNMKPNAQQEGDNMSKNECDVNENDGESISANECNVHERYPFGVCPVCGRNDDGYLDIGRTRWGVCHKHKNKWVIRTDRSSDWEGQTEADYWVNSHQIEDYEDIGSVRYPVVLTQGIDRPGSWQLMTDKGRLLLSASEQPIKRFLQLDAFGTNASDQEGRRVYKLSSCGTPVQVQVHEGTKKEDAIMMLTRLLAWLLADWEFLVGKDWDKTRDDWSTYKGGDGPFGVDFGTGGECEEHADFYGERTDP